MADQPDLVQQKIDDAPRAAVDNFLVQPIPPLNVPTPEPTSVRPKRTHVPLIARIIIMLLMISLPVTTFFISQRRQPVADVRSKAASGGRCEGGCYLPIRLECYPDENSEASCRQKGCDWGFTTCGDDKRSCGPCTNQRCWGSCDGKNESDCRNTKGCSWKTDQQINSCSQSWPRNPTPRDGATNVSLSPTFSWDQDVGSGGGYYANVYIWDCPSGNDSCLIGFGGRESETRRITEIPLNEIHPYYAPNKPDYNRSLTLMPNKQYWWYVTPGVCRVVHFEENKRWTFTTSTSAPTPTATPTPAAQCQRIKVYKGGTVISDLTTLRTGDQVELAVVGTNATKARIRVNGGSWNETSTKNSAGEYTVAFTIPVATFNFTIEAEVFQSGLWQ